MRLILASQSPRRHQLMTEAGYDFDVVQPSEHAECGICTKETTPEMVARLALQKAKDVAPRIEGPAILIACDTVADLMGRVLGKPEDRHHADEMIRLLSGRRHAVYSGLCVWRLPEGQPMLRVCKSELQMLTLSEEQIETYLDSDAWIGKSGAFGYQDDHPWLKLLSGTADNVVGLPMQEVAELLAKAKSE